MPTLDRPKLRPLSASRFDHQGRSYALIQDPLGAFTNPVLVPLDLFVQVCRHFDGELTLDEIARGCTLRRERSVPRRCCERLVAELDSAMVLDGPTFASFQESFRARRSGPRRWRVDLTPPAKRPCGSSLATTSPAREGPARRLCCPPAHGAAIANSRGAQPAHRLQPGRTGLHLVVQGAGRRHRRSTRS